MKKSDLDFTLVLKKKRNKIRISGVVLNCFEYENEKLKEKNIYKKERC